MQAPASHVVIEIDARLARDALARTGSLRIRVRGGSMGPWLRSGELVEVVPVVAGDVLAGDVIVFERAGRLIAHRAVRRTPAGWLTRGDALDRHDDLVGDASIVGRVRGVHVRGVRLRASRRVGAMLGRALAAATPFLLYARRRLGRR